MLFTTVNGQYYSIFIKYTKNMNVIFSFLCFSFTVLSFYCFFNLFNLSCLPFNQIIFIASFPLLVESYIVWFESYISWFGLLSLTFKNTQLYVDRKKKPKVNISIHLPSALEVLPFSYFFLFSYGEKIPFPSISSSTQIIGLYAHIIHRWERKKSDLLV